MGYQFQQNYSRSAEQKGRQRRERPEGAAEVRELGAEAGGHGGGCAGGGITSLASA
jgi:hypothetical protein